MNVTLIGGILAFIATVAVAAITAWQARRGARDSPYDDMRQALKDSNERIDKLQNDVDSLRDEARGAKDEAHQARNAAEQAITENMAWEGHHLGIVREHVATLRKPWPPIPTALLHRITHDDYPALPVIPDPDPGTPGTE